MTRWIGLSLALACLFTPACYTFEHTVGSGPSTGEEVEEAQWFILWGLVPLGGETDSKEMAGTATNYRVTTQFTPLDVVISFLTGWVTIYKQTVIVEK
jgi:hypothetical protein